MPVKAHLITIFSLMILLYFYLSRILSAGHLFVF